MYIQTRFTPYTLQYVVPILLIEGMSGVQHMLVSDTYTTLTHGHI
jgi:hypothetical protein